MRTIKDHLLLSTVIVKSFQAENFQFCFYVKFQRIFLDED